MLQGQRPAIQDFLLRTSILDRLSAPLCDAVLEVEAGQRPDSQAILEGLERDNLFVVTLDEERRWYRYHNLFCDVLEHRLRRGDPARVPELHLRAAAW